MDIFKVYATDSKLEVEGRWVKLGGTDDKPSRIKVARTGTAAYNACMQAYYTAHQADLDSNIREIAEAAQTRATIHTFARQVLKDWENMSYQGNTVLTVELAESALSHRDFLELVAVEARKQEAYRLHRAEADSKN